MASEPHESDKPFKVQDRRRFSASGEARAEPEVAAADPAPAAAPAESPTGAAPAAAAADSAAHPGEPPQLTLGRTRSDR